MIGFNIFYNNHIVANLNFPESSYIINENDGLLHSALLLSNPSSTDVTVQVLTSNDSANGECINYLAIKWMVAFIH